MKLLSIGNSFSVDAHRYIPRIARDAGLPISLMNLYIGGCSLERHHRNMKSEARAYELHMNGEPAYLSVSIKEALLATDWDVITLQQASHFSNRFETYAPYIGALADYIRALCPGAKLMLHETWAYEDGSERLTDMMGYTRSVDMSNDIRVAYRRAKEAISADGIIPCGTAMAMAAEQDIAPLHRDTFHASLGEGRLLLAATWLTALFQRSLVGIPLPASLDAPVSPDAWARLLAIAARANDI